MNTIRRIVALSVLPVLLGAAPPATKFNREILRRGQGTEVVIVPIDDPIYEATRDGFPDVRVVDDRGEEVPYVLGPVHHPKTVASREVVPSRVVALNPVEGGPLEVTVELEGDAPEPDGLTVLTPLVDFERQIRVQGSRDGNSWTSLAEGRIFDYSRYMNVRNVELRFPARGFRRFRLVFDREADQQRSPFAELSRTRGAHGGEQKTEFEAVLRRPFRIDRIELYRTVMKPAAGDDEPGEKAELTVTRIETDRSAGQTRIEFDGRRLPLRRVKLLTHSRNFRRTAHLQAPGKADWADVGRGVLLLYHLGDYQREDMTLDVWLGGNSRRAESLRIVVENGDEPPLDVVGVEGLYDDHRIQFIAEEGRDYRLYYGSATLDDPHYEDEIVRTALVKHREREVAALGEPIRDPTYHSSLPQTTRAIPAWVLTLALAVMTLVLAWAIAQAVRRVEKAPLDYFDG